MEGVNNCGSISTGLGVVATASVCGTLIGGGFGRIVAALSEGANHEICIRFVSETIHCATGPKDVAGIHNAMRICVDSISSIQDFELMKFYGLVGCTISVVGSVYLLARRPPL